LSQEEYDQMIKENNERLEQALQILVPCVILAAVVVLYLLFKCFGFNCADVCAKLRGQRQQFEDDA